MRRPIAQSKTDRIAVMEKWGVG